MIKFIFKIQMKAHLIKVTNIITFAFFISLAYSAAYSYSTCPTTSYLNSANLACVACPTNQISNNYQTVATACQCQPGYRLPSNPNINACTQAFSTTCSAATTSYYPLLNIDGSATTGTANCIACTSTSYPNR